MDTLKEQAQELIKLAGDGSGEWPDQFFAVDSWRVVRANLKQQGINHNPRAFKHWERVIVIFQPLKGAINVYRATPELLAKTKEATAGDDFILEGFSTDDNNENTA